MYLEYISKPLQNIEKRFYCGTFHVYINMGKLLKFNWLIYPSTCDHEYVTDICDLTVENFSILLETINFAPKSVTDIKQLLFEYGELVKFTCETAGECRDNFSVNHFVQNMLKQFVNKYGSKFPILYSFLPYGVSFPTSEAVVGSWGSSIDHLNKNKPHAKEVIGLDDTDTIDKLAFVRLNGPHPGFQKNRRLFKSALQLMYQDNFTKDFLYVDGRNLKTTSLVIERIINSNDNILPCFLG